jgi:DNA-binding XRE family transcriptional regulator
MNKPLTIRQYRKMYDFSQEKMAELLGISVGTYIRYEKKPLEIPIHRALDMCQIFDTTLDRIIFLQEQSTNM